MEIEELAPRARNGALNRAKGPAGSIGHPQHQRRKDMGGRQHGCPKVSA